MIVIASTTIIKYSGQLEILVGVLSEANETLLSASRFLKDLFMKNLIIKNNKNAITIKISAVMASACQ